MKNIYNSRVANAITSVFQQHGLSHFLRNFWGMFLIMSSFIPISHGQSVTDFNNSGCPPGANAYGDCSAAIGAGAKAGTSSNDYAYAIGRFAYAEAFDSYAFGCKIGTSSGSIGNIVIGSGGAVNFMNGIDHSIMLGTRLNTSTPTMFIEDGYADGGNWGRVGIGTTDQDGLLHLLDESGTNTNLIIEAQTNQSSQIWFEQSGSDIAKIRTTSGGNLVIENNSNNDDLIFEVNDGGVHTEVMRIRGTNSSVGIGTVSPQQLLHVQNGQLLVKDQTGEGVVTIEGGNSGIDAATLFLNASDLTEGDDWSISNRSADNLFYIQNNDGSATRPLEIETGAPTASVRIKNNGNVGIGTSTPQGKLDVNGSLFANLATGSGGNTVQLVSGQLVEFTSTINHKKDIEDLHFDKEAFLSLRPVSYRWKEAHGGGNDVGLIAEEVEQLMPNMVNYNYKHTYINEITGELLRDSIGNPVLDSTALQPWGVDYRKISVYLLAIVKEQDSLLNNMQDRLSSLESVVLSCCSAQPAYRSGSIGGPDVEQFEEVSLKVYPNPNDGNFTVNYKLNKGETGKLFLISLSGEKVLLSDNVHSTGKDSFNLSGPSGVYQITLEKNNGETLKNVKVVITR